MWDNLFEDDDNEGNFEANEEDSEVCILRAVDPLSTIPTKFNDFNSLLLFYKYISRTSLSVKYYFFYD